MAISIRGNATAPSGRIVAKGWGLVWGRRWMVQWNLDRTFSLGVHIDPNDRGDFGPYVDVHLVFAAVSFGRDPARANNYSLMRPRSRSHHAAGN